MNYIFFEPSWRQTKPLFNDLQGLKNTIVFPYIQRNAFLERLSKSHLDGKLSVLPFKKIWSLFATANLLKVETKYVFVFIGLDLASIAVRCNLIKRLQKKYPGSKFVAYDVDVIEEDKFYNAEIRKSFDLFYNMDEEDSRSKGMIYYPLPFSRGTISDISFIGQDKGRLDEIVSIHDFLTQNGIKCDFYIAGVPQNKQINREGIMYGDYLDYDTTLNRFIVNTNCVLELHVDGRTCCSDRVQKAIAYNRKILTNDRSLLKNPFYKSEMIKIYNSVDDIDIDFLKESVFKKKYDYNDEYSPIHFLKKIKSDLSID